MAVVHLRRDSDNWLIQIADAEGAEAERKALNHANGFTNSQGDEIPPSNGPAGWEVVETHSDDKFDALREEHAS